MNSPQAGTDYAGRPVAFSREQEAARHACEWCGEPATRQATLEKATKKNPQGVRPWACATHASMIEESQARTEKRRKEEKDQIKQFGKVVR